MARIKSDSCLPESLTTTEELSSEVMRRLKAGHGPQAPLQQATCTEDDEKVFAAALMDHFPSREDASVSKFSKDTSPGPGFV